MAPDQTEHTTAKALYVNVWNSKVIQRQFPYDRPWYWQKKEARDRYHNEKEYYHDKSFADVTRQRKTDANS